MDFEENNPHTPVKESLRKSYLDKGKNLKKSVVKNLNQDLINEEINSEENDEKNNAEQQSENNLSKKFNDKSEKIPKKGESQKNLNHSNHLLTKSLFFSGFFIVFIVVLSQLFYEFFQELENQESIQLECKTNYFLNECIEMVPLTVLECLKWEKCMTQNAYTKAFFNLNLAIIFRNTLTDILPIRHLMALTSLIIIFRYLSKTFLIR